METHTPDTYELRPLTHERLDTLSREWIVAAAGDVDAFDVELSAVISWARDHIEHREGDSHALELYNETRNQSEAIIEMVSSRRGALSKMLKLWVSPEFWAVRNGDELYGRIIDLHAAAFAKVAFDSIDNGVEEVKIYGRTELMLDMLVTLEKIWNSSNSGWTANIAGRWLAISR